MFDVGTLWLKRLFKTGDSGETLEQARSRRVTLLVTLVPALVILLVAVTKLHEHPAGGLAGAPEALAGVILALVTGAIPESRGRGYVVLLATGGLLYLLRTALLVPQYSDDWGSWLATVAFALGGLVQAAWDLSKHPLLPDRPVVAWTPGSTDGFTQEGPGDPPRWIKVLQVPADLAPDRAIRAIARWREFQFFWSAAGIVWALFVLVSWDAPSQSVWLLLVAYPAAYVVLSAGAVFAAEGWARVAQLLGLALATACALTFGVGGLSLTGDPRVVLVLFGIFTTSTAVLGAWANAASQARLPTRYLLGQLLNSLILPLVLVVPVVDGNPVPRSLALAALVAALTPATTALRMRVRLT